MVKPFDPCEDQLNRVKRATDEASLLVVIYENLNWCSERKFLTTVYFEKFDKETFINSGIANTGLECTGFANSGNWNSGDSNSGYRNSGAFCANSNPKVWLFDKPTDIYVRDWEQSRPFRLMLNGLSFTFWINASEMNEQEKKANPKYETTEGYLKTIPHNKGWANFWGNLSDEDKKEFTSLPNFDASTFFKCTGIQL